MTTHWQGQYQERESTGGVRSTPTIPVDLAETEREVIVEASLPGVSPEDVSVSVEGLTLTIRATLKPREARPARRWVVRERAEGTVFRTVTLPCEVDADRTDARLEHGVLTVTLPRAAVASAQRVPVGVVPLRDRPSANVHDEFQGGPDATAGGDVVTEQSQESFPASDPPSWTPQQI